MYDEGLNSRGKLDLYRTFTKKVGFKKYWHRMSDAESRLLVKFKVGRESRVYFVYMVPNMRV